MMFGEWAVTAVRRADTHEKSHFKALPVAIDVVKAVLTQPTELRLDIEQAVGGIFVLERLVDRRKNAMCRRWVADATCSRFANTPPGSSRSKTSPYSERFRSCSRWWMAIDETTTSKRPSFGLFRPLRCPITGESTGGTAKTRTAGCTHGSSC